MCFALDMPCGASGIYLISKRSYIEWAQPIYRICTSKYIDKSRTANAVRLFLFVFDIRNASVEKDQLSTTMSSRGRQPVAISWDGVGIRTRYQEIATSPVGSSQ